MKTRHFDQMPKAYVAYPKVLKSVLNKKPAPKKKLLSQVTYVVDALKIDAQHLQRYNALCGFGQDGTVPAIYLAVLAQSLQMQMMTSEPFPFALLGLVHIRNQIKQHRVITQDEVLTLSCAFGELQPHDKGLQFDFIITAKVGDDVVMEGVTTYLSRQKVTEKSVEKAKAAKHPVYQPHATIEVAENTGRRYALISGDFNLIHIHALTAKAFGFKKAIAHGMWTKAKALVALSPLPASYEVDIWFKLPIFLPSTVELKISQQEKTTDILVSDRKNNKPHLTGELVDLS